MRMGAKGAKYIWVRFGDFNKLVAVGNARGNGHQYADTGVSRPRNDIAALLGQFREIEMAMMIDKHHGQLPSLSST